MDVTNIVEKYLNNAKIIVDGLEGKKYPKKVDDEIIDELANSDLSVLDLVKEDVLKAVADVQGFMETLPEVQNTFDSMKSFVELPKILQGSYIQFKKLNNGDKLLSVFPNGLNGGLFVYRFEEDESKFVKILELPAIDDEEDIRAIDNIERYDIIYNVKEEKYQFFWVSLGDKKIREAFIENGTLTGIDVISNNTAEKGGRLTANMNDSGDIVVFTSAKATDGYFAGIMVSKERSLNSWQTTDLLEHEDSKNDYNAYGNVQVIGDDFYYGYTNGDTRFYVVKVTNSDNQLITSTVSENAKIVNPVCQYYEQYDAVNDKTEYFIVFPNEVNVPRVVKVQSTLEIGTLDKLPVSGSYKNLYVFTQDGICIVNNRFTRNFGEQWIENQLCNTVATQNSIRSNDYVIGVFDKEITILKLEDIIKFNSPITIK